MEDGSSSRRRVRTGRKADGAYVAVVLEVTEDGFVGMCRSGETTFFDTREVSKVVDDFRALQAIALQGVRWNGIQ